MDTGGGISSCSSRVYVAAAADHVNNNNNNHNSAFLLHQQSHDQHLSSNPDAAIDHALWSSSSSPPSFHASDSMVVTYDDSAVLRQQRRQREPPEMAAAAAIDDDDDFENFGHHQQEKKRRLTVEQVRCLERSFEVENRLEPERKVELAKELGLQPRQVAIWFQNRRARFKTKQLEKDYDSLKAEYDRLMVDYESVVKEKERLKNEVTLLTSKLKTNGKESPNSHPPSPTPQEIAVAFVKLENATKTGSMLGKQEDASSAKSDVLDSESPHGIEGNHSSLLETANSSNFFDPEPSDFSQDEDDQYLSRSLLQPPPSLPLPVPLMPPPYNLPPLQDDECYNDDPQCNSGTISLPAEDQQLWSWLCQT